MWRPGWKESNSMGASSSEEYVVLYLCFLFVKRKSFGRNRWSCLSNMELIWNKNISISTVNAYNVKKQKGDIFTVLVCWVQDKWVTKLYLVTLQVYVSSCGSGLFASAWKAWIELLRSLGEECHCATGIHGKMVSSAIWNQGMEIHR